MDYDKYKKGAIIYTDYFLGKGVYERFEIISVWPGDSKACITLTNERTYKLYDCVVDLNILVHNNSFFTISEIRLKKLKKINENHE